MVAMALELIGAPFQLDMIKDGSHKVSDNLPPQFGSCWYFTRKEIENFSPSRKDGINLEEESELRKCYCSFLKDFGIRLGVPQVTIATAIVFCHRFYLHQSHTKNDWQTVATVCMFLASKVEDTPLSLDKITRAAYEMLYRRDPATARQIHQKDVFEKQKGRILIGEKLLLSTIRFDFNIQHPYRALLHALKKFGITQKDTSQVAWNFVNDSLHTTLCLQYKPHYIAAASIFLSAKINKVKLPYVWWNEFDIMPQQLHAAVQEMMDLLGYMRRPVVTCVLEKPTAMIPTTTSVAKEETSCSPESCVLSRPGSLRSNSGQSSQGGAGGQKPIGIIVPSNTGNSNQDGQQHTSMIGRIELQSQSSQGGEGGKKPFSIIVPSCTSNSNLDGQQHTLMTGLTEMQSQERDSESLNTITKNSQVYGEHVNQATTKLEQVPDVEVCLMSGEVVEKITSEQVVPVEDFQGIGEDLGQGRPDPEEFIDAGDYQIPYVDVQARRGPAQTAVAEDCQVSKGVDQARTELAQSVNNEVSQQYRDSVGQAAGNPEGEDVNNEVSQAYGENLNPAGANPEEVANNKFSQASGKGAHQTRVKPEQAVDELSKMHKDRIEALMTGKLELETTKRTVVSQGYESVDLAMPKSEEAASNEFSLGSSECADQARVKPEQVEGGLHKIDKDRIKALMMRRKRERESNKKTEDMDDLNSEIGVQSGDGMDQAMANTEPVANCEIAQGSGQGVNQLRANCEQVEDGFCKIDVNRIKALRMRRKKERESNKRTGAMDDGDSLIERELEAGIEFRAEFCRKKQRLG